MSRVALFCELNVIERYMDDFLPLIKTHSQTCLEMESGCVIFRVSQDRDNPLVIRIYEEYLEQADLDKHNSTDRFSELNAKIEHMLSGVIVHTTDLCE